MLARRDVLGDIKLFPEETGARGRNEWYRVHEGDERCPETRSASHVHAAQNFRRSGKTHMTAYTPVCDAEPELWKVCEVH